MFLKALLGMYVISEGLRISNAISIPHVQKYMSPSIRQYAEHIAPIDQVCPIWPLISFFSAQLAKN